MHKSGAFIFAKGENKAINELFRQVREDAVVISDLTDLYN